MRINLKATFMVLGTLALTVSYQNCARQGFNTATQSSLESASTSSSSQSDSSSTSSSQNSSQTSSNSQGSSANTISSAPNIVSVPSTVTTSTSSVSNSNSNSSTSSSSSASGSATSGSTSSNSGSGYISSLVNIVAGDQSTCDQVVADALRKKLSSGVMSVVAPRCQIGAGCGISCGKPNGTTCLSANPKAYGACLDSADFDTYVMSNMQVFNQKSGFNFGAGSESDCNSSIQERHLYATGVTPASSKYCKVGGGCGLSCGKPNGTTCVSANPNVMGACFGYDEFRNL